MSATISLLSQLTEAIPHTDTPVGGNLPRVAGLGALRKHCGGR